MENNDLNRLIIMEFNGKKIYFIGIKGVGMTMLAQYLSAQGNRVSGSDIADKFMTDAVLEKCGIKVKEKFDPANLPADADLIIYSTAYNEATNTEVAAALKGKIKVLTYAQALGEVFNQKYGIAVVGSHGKTTTAAWLGYVLKQAGLEPGVMVGASVPQLSGCSLRGLSEYLVAEVDEYQNKLNYFSPKAVILNNIDYDHPDFFPSPSEYQRVFVEFIKKLPATGFLVANFDDPAIRQTALVNCRGKVITYALNEAADYVAYDLRSYDGKQYFKVKFGLTAEDDPAADEEARTDELGDFVIQLAGRHNISNALAVIAASIELNVELFKIRKYLEEFIGTARRMQVMGEFRGATIIDDYAHHPTEIKATVGALRQKYGQRRIIAVFHPHTFSRTKALFADFVGSFDQIDELIILDIYGSAREKQGGVHSRDLAEAIMSRNQAAGNRQNVKYISSLAAGEKYLRGKIERSDLVVLMGAGDVFRIGESLIKPGN